MPTLKRKSTTELIDVYLNDEAMVSWDGDGHGSSGASSATATTTAAVAGTSAPPVAASVPAHGRGARSADALSD